MAADDDKKLILARRAKFVAAALAGVSVACGKEPTPPPEPCLSVPMDNRDAGPPEPPPQPCLTPMMMPVDAGPPATANDASDASAGDAGTGAKDAGTPPPKPTPCLAPPLPSTAPTKPMPCLTPVRPPDKGTR